LLNKIKKEDKPQTDPVWNLMALEVVLRWRATPVERTALQIFEKQHTRKINFIKPQEAWKSFQSLGDKLENRIYKDLMIAMTASISPPYPKIQTLLEI
jgi:hypothetical protein